MNRNRKNLYTPYFIGLVLICCFVFSIAFLYVNYKSIRELELQNNTKKMEQVLADWEIQVDELEKAALKVSLKKEYQPYVFLENKYQEKLLLEDFEYYSNYSVLTKECFLYYGGENIFCSTGHIKKLNVFLKELKESDRALLHTELTNITAEKKKILLSDKLYMLYPIRVLDNISGLQRSDAYMIFVINTSSIEERFSVVSGGINGKVSLYYGNSCLYSNSEEVLEINNKDNISVFGKDKKYVIYFQPDDSVHSIWRLLPAWTFLFLLIDVMAVFVVAHYFARKTFRPVLEIVDKYQNVIEIPGGNNCENILQEIDFMVDNLLENNRNVKMQVEQKQELLHRQFLRTLINGNIVSDINHYMGRLNMKLDGPFYFVVTIAAFTKGKELEAFYCLLIQELEQISNEEERIYVYAIMDIKQEQINVVCSISQAIQKEGLVEHIYEISTSHSHEIVMGVGGIYNSLNQMHASWLESVDQIHKKTIQQNSETGINSIYDIKDLKGISKALAKGNQEESLKCFESYMQKIGDGQISFLMQRYVFMDFMSEMVKLAQKHNIELSKTNLSQMVSVYDTKDFYKASIELIQEFCEKMKSSKQQIEDEELLLDIYEYVNSHFMDYEISIENVALELNTTTAVVRQAILKHSGKMYKDYLIYLRIEYAKRLLREENMTVAEICQKVGYSNLSHFIKLFKEMNGVTPAKYKDYGNEKDEI